MQAITGIFAVALLSGCSGFDSGSPGGVVIHNPTVQDMAQYESQWGVKPRQVKPRYRAAGPGDFMEETPAPPVSQPALEPAPAPPQLQEPAPDPIPAPQPPPAPDAATINKLR